MFDDSTKKGAKISVPVSCPDSLVEVWVSHPGGDFEVKMAPGGDFIEIKVCPGVGMVEVRISLPERSSLLADVKQKMALPEQPIIEAYAHNLGAEIRAATETLPEKIIEAAVEAVSESEPLKVTVEAAPEEKTAYNGLEADLSAQKPHVEFLPSQAETYIPDPKVVESAAQKALAEFQNAIGKRSETNAAIEGDAFEVVAPYMGSVREKLPSPREVEAVAQAALDSLALQARPEVKSNLSNKFLVPELTTIIPIFSDKAYKARQDAAEKALERIKTNGLGEATESLAKSEKPKNNGNGKANGNGKFFPTPDHQLAWKPEKLFIDGAEAVTTVLVEFITDDLPDSIHPFGYLEPLPEDERMEISPETIEGAGNEPLGPRHEDGFFQARPMERALFNNTILPPPMK